jgi:flagellar motor switch protein FliN/FliY
MDAQGNLREWILARWRDRFAEALGTMTGVPVAKSELPAGPAAAADWWEQGFSIGPEAKVWVGAPAETWKLFGRVALEAAGLGGASDDDVKGTYQEILSQSLSGLAAALGGALGGEVTCAKGGYGPAPAGEASGTEFQLEGLGGGPVYFVVSAGLAAPATAAAAAAAAPEPAAAEAPRAAGAFDLLLDVEMPVSVSFGRAHIPLKEVLKLTSGSIVELNRAVTEPVEIIVNNCVVAKGEVVVIEGNYGVRIHQVISRSERLRTLY